MNSKDQIAEIVQQIRKLDEREAKGSQLALKSAIEKGGLLTQAREVVGHGKFMAWVKEQKFKFTHATANNYMKLYEKQAEIKLQNVCNLSDAYRLLRGEKKGTKDKPEVTVKLPMTKAMRDQWLEVTAKLVEKFPDAGGLANVLLSLVKEKLKESGNATTDSTQNTSTTRASGNTTRGASGQTPLQSGTRRKAS